MKVYDGSNWLAAYASLSGALIATNNLSDLVSASTARTNLGLGTAATTASTDYATAAQGAVADSALQDITGESIEDLSDVATMTPTDGQLLTWDSVTSKWNAEDAPVSLPDQTGQSGNYLTTNGTSASWGTVDLSSKLDLSGGTMTGAITFAAGQTFDGRDVSADGSKLDGIESGATADQTAAEILTAIKTVDGSGSGLDADTVDGIQASSFLQGNQTITLSGDVSGSGTTSITTTVANNSHSHTTSTLSGNISAFTNDSGYTTNVGDITAVTAGSYLTGGGTSGGVTLNVDATTASTASKVVARDSSGDINARLFRSEFDSTNATVNYIMTQIDTASNNYIRPSTPAQFRSAVTDGSYPTKTGGGASGTWGISITGNAGSVDGYSASTTRNAANTIPVRDANGYANFGWINTTSGDTSGTLSRAFVEINNDGYIRTCTMAHLASQMGAAQTSASGCIYENSQTITSNYTMTTNKNGHSAGPITINTGVTVTIPTGSNWVVS